jgi:hypothetical protein
LPGSTEHRCVTLRDERCERLIDLLGGESHGPYPELLDLDRPLLECLEEDQVRRAGGQRFQCRNRLWPESAVPWRIGIHNLTAAERFAW